MLEKFLKENNLWKYSTQKFVEFLREHEAEDDYFKKLLVPEITSLKLIHLFNDHNNYRELLAMVSWGEEGISKYNFWNDLDAIWFRISIEYQNNKHSESNINHYNR